VQPALKGSLADSGDLGGLLRGEALDIAQHDRGPQRWRQPGQGSGQGQSQLVVLCLPGGVIDRRGRQLELLRSDRNVGRSAVPPCQCAVGLVHRDPVEPGEVAGPALEPGNAPPGAQHDFLGYLARLVGVPKQTQQQHVQAIGIRAG
jgi:hypothetical protein